MKTMRMESIEVFLNNEGTVSIRQDNSFEEPSVIAIHHSQVPLLCEWLKAAAAEMDRIEREADGQ